MSDVSSSTHHEITALAALLNASLLQTGVNVHLEQWELLEHDKTRMRTLLIKISHVRESSIRFISNMRAY